MHPCSICAGAALTGSNVPSDNAVSSMSPLSFENKTSSVSASPASRKSYLRHGAAVPHSRPRVTAAAMRNEMLEGRRLGLGKCRGGRADGHGASPTRLTNPAVGGWAVEYPAAQYAVSNPGAQSVVFSDLESPT